jgi:hypothetical protein
MRRRWSNFLLGFFLIVLAATIIIWVFSYVGTVGHIWRTGTFLLEGKENVDSFFGITATRGVLRVEQFATREPAHEVVKDSKVSRVQTTRVAMPLWSFTLVYCAILIFLARRRRIRRYDASPG